ncbi:hypothetical protein Aau02nite_48810 [Amorphoplanes auranticolor]|uniref:Uncharacterized protein n=1 Tax=Actinoplanes auranticolor TaxID=47988 RepID=A0A919SGJ9_9ACTN|nr:hypothetical protein Aau02nite_48810 [Actinoplanes auranticolor]
MRAGKRPDVEDRRPVRSAKPPGMDTTDTVADPAMDGLGSIIAGVAVTAWAARGFSRRRVRLDR